MAARQYEQPPNFLQPAQKNPNFRLGLEGKVCAWITYFKALAGRNKLRAVLVTEPDELLLELRMLLERTGRTHLFWETEVWE